MDNINVTVKSKNPAVEPKSLKELTAEMAEVKGTIVDINASVEQAEQDVERLTEAVANSDDFVIGPGNKMKRKPKAYAPAEYSGLGEIYLDKNMKFLGREFEEFVSNPNVPHPGTSIGDPDGIVYDRVRQAFIGYRNIEGSRMYTDTWDEQADYTAASGYKYLCTSTETAYKWQNGDLVETAAINGNVLTQAMLDFEHTIYHIQYDYDLNGRTIEVPDGCVLQFDGGSLKNGTIIGDYSRIEAGLVKIFDTDISFIGTWGFGTVYPEWFGAKGDGVNDDTAAIQACLNLTRFRVTNIRKTVLTHGTYKTTDTLIIYPFTSLIGNSEVHSYLNPMIVNNNDNSDIIMLHSSNSGGVNLNPSGIEIRNLNLNGKKSAIVKEDGKGVSRVKIENITFTSVRYGVNFENNAMFDIVISDCFIEKRTVGLPIRIVTTDYIAAIYISNCDFTYSYIGGILIETQTGCTTPSVIEKCCFDHCGHDYSLADYNTLGIFGVKIKSGYGIFDIHDCYFESNCPIRRGNDAGEGEAVGNNGNFVYLTNPDYSKTAEIIFDGYEAGKINIANNHFSVNYQTIAVVNGGDVNLEGNEYMVPGLNVYGFNKLSSGIIYVKDRNNECAYINIKAKIGHQQERNNNIFGYVPNVIAYDDSTNPIDISLDYDSKPQNKKFYYKDRKYGDNPTVYVSNGVSKTYSIGDADSPFSSLLALNRYNLQKVKVVLLKDCNINEQSTITLPSNVDYSIVGQYFDKDSTISYVNGAVSGTTVLSNQVALNRSTYFYGDNITVAANSSLKLPIGCVLLNSSYSALITTGLSYTSSCVIFTPSADTTVRIASTKTKFSFNQNINVKNSNFIFSWIEFVKDTNNCFFSDNSNFVFNNSNINIGFDTSAGRAFISCEKGLSNICCFYTSIYIGGETPPKLFNTTGGKLQVFMQNSPLPSGLTYYTSLPLAYSSSLETQDHLIGDTCLYTGDTKRRRLAIYNGSKWTDTNGNPITDAAVLGSFAGRPELDKTWVGFTYTIDEGAMRRQIVVSEFVKLAPEVIGTSGEKFRSNTIAENNVVTAKVIQAGANDTIKMYFTKTNSAIGNDAIEVPLRFYKNDTSSFNTFVSDPVKAPNPSTYPYVCFSVVSSTDTFKFGSVNQLDWYDNDGAKATVNRNGVFASRPAAADIYVGFAYFCTDKQTTEGATDGIMIYHKGSDVWVDALGRIVS